MSQELKILFVEDSEEDMLLLLHHLQKAGFGIKYSRVQAEGELKEALAGESWDIIISDFRMPDFSANRALELLKESGGDLPFLIVSGKIGEDQAVAAMKAGATDYLMKDNLSRLVPAVERALREAEERRRRHKAELAILTGKVEWEAVFDAVSDLILVTDYSGIVTRCNRRVIEYFQSDYPDIIGRKISSLFYGDNGCEDDIFLSSARSQTGMEDIRFPSLSGWFTVTSCPMVSMDAGETARRGVVHIVKDVSRRKRMEEEKRVSDRELLTLYAVAFRLNSERDSKELLNDMLFQIHNMLRIDFSSIHLLEKGGLKLKASLGFSADFEPAVKRLLNYAPWVGEVLAGKPYKARALASKEMPQEVIEAAKNIGIHAWCAVPLKIGSEIVGVLMVAHKSEKNFSDREVFLLTSIGSQLAVLIENHQLYERMKEKAAELQRSRKALRENLHEVKLANIELDRLNRAKNSFIGMASHELKTPITSILGGVEFLLKYSNIALTTEQGEIFSSVHESVVQLKNLVEDLLSISRIEAKGIVLQKRPLSLISISREVFDGFALPLSRRNVNVQIMGDERPIPADEGFARLVIRNLMENAIKFTPDGGEIIIICRQLPREEVLAERSVLKEFYPIFPKGFPEVAQYCRMDFCDNGIGIPSEERLRVFEKFYGVGDIAYHSSGKTEFMSKGSGLGLSIVKGIMDAHNGYVWVTDGPTGRGSMFSILFPAEEQLPSALECS
ncbi:ethylene receptor [Geobacter sp. OR-1]|uniref:hybrid sensor histidine kinase/response regulator n=1 Tax=Geobacter sp. OR-1 TaxID=1266765 RepID=UPI000541B640|nr:ATP-binding protein [Geobacter sp. OR-1]GAM08482.1 ethylene receptor [Geobacter sp. OR-1]